MSVVVKTKKGKEITLLNPSEKGGKFAAEILAKCKITNDGILKVDKKGNPLTLTPKEQAYRAGYLDAQKDSAKAYKHRQKKKKAAQAAKRAAKAKGKK